MKPPVDMPMEGAARGMKPSKAGEEIKSEWPGSIKFANERGHFFGSRVEVLDAEEINAWADQHPNHVIVEVLAVGMGRKLAVVWTKTLSDAELEEMTSIQREAEVIHAKKKEERAKLQEEAEAKAQEEQKARAAKAAAELDELQRLAQLARKMAKRDELLKFSGDMAKMLAKLAGEMESGDPRISQIAELIKGAPKTNLLKGPDDAAPGK